MTVLLDNGHGGLTNGEYRALAGGRFFRHPDGTTIYEGEFNRFVVAGIMMELTKLGIKYVNICPEHHDMTLETRVRRANEYSNIPCFLMSIHANAGRGHGFEVFSSAGETRSDKIATIIGQEFLKEFPTKRLRTDFSDGDLDKEHPNFYILRRTRMPAILTENFFMDNLDECKNILLTYDGRQKIISYHAKAIVRTFDELF